MKKILLVLKSSKTLALTCLAFTFPVLAVDASSPIQNKICHGSQVLLVKFITDVCRSCIFPIKLADINLSMTGTASDNAVSGTACAHKDGLSAYHPGVSTAMWEPRKLTELTKTPECMSSLGGVTLGLGNDLQSGPQADGTAEEQRERFSISFYNTHTYAMPLLRMLGMYLPDQCNTDPYNDFDITSFTETDPTRNGMMLAFFQNPESVAVANVMVMRACAGEAAVQFTGKQPIDLLWWCVSSWGRQYPLIGLVRDTNVPRTTSLVGIRMLAMEYRRRLTYRSMENDTVCRSKTYPALPRQQYKLNMFYFTPETKNSHEVGESPCQWQGGPFRYPTGRGRDNIYMIFQWIDCCHTT